jgi:hypothetical protein
MIVEAQVPLHASRAAAWAVLTDIAGAADILSGVETIEVTSKPEHGLVGLRWRETRILFGKPETVEKWITAAVEPESYTTRAEAQGFAYLATLRLAEGADGLTLTSAHEARPLGLGAWFMAIPLRLFFRGAIRKALLQDLNDLKAAAERKDASGA